MTYVKTIAVIFSIIPVGNIFKISSSAKEISDGIYLFISKNKNLYPHGADLSKNILRKNCTKGSSSLSFAIEETQKGNKLLISYCLKESNR